MIILVDSGVWIDYFRNRFTAETEALDELLAHDADLATCGIILTEVLQGIRTENQYQKVSRLLAHLLYLPLEKEDYEQAALLYRAARRKGKTVRTTVDAIIAAVAIRHQTLLLHHDRDYAVLAQLSGLQCWKRS